MSTILPSPGDKKPVQFSAININEAEQEYVLYVETPGMQREDISVSVEKGVITIVASGNKLNALSNHDKQNAAEWKKSVKLPQNADPLLTAATYSNGELQIHIPKGDNTEEKPMMIHVY